MAELERNDVDVASRLRVSDSCPVILPYHAALDKARERVSGARAIGTTGRGIGPAYEDKVARRGVRVGDLLEPDVLREKLAQVLEFHNFVLTQYYQQDAIDFNKTLDEALAHAERLQPLVADVGELVAGHVRAGEPILFEGAQGTFLDIDHGTYPYVTSSSTCAANAALGSGVGPQVLG